MRSDLNKGHERVDCSHVSLGAVPKNSANAFRSCSSKPENAKPFKVSDGPESLDSTNANEPVNVFDFSSLDLGKSMFASEDHTQILMQADNLLQTTKHQLLDLQMTMSFEGKQCRVENRLSELSLSSDASMHPGGDLTSAVVQGTQSDPKTHVQSGPLSSSKQKKPKEFINKKSIPVQNKTRKMPRNFTKQPHITNNHPSNSDILNEMHRTQASLQGGLSTAKGVSAHLEVMAGREGKKIQFHKSGLESGKPNKLKFKRRQDESLEQIDNGIHLTSHTPSIQVPGGVSQSLANDQIVDISNDASIPKFSLTSEHSYVGTSDVHVCTNQLSKSQLQNIHSQTDVESQVKRRQRKLVSEHSATFRNTDTEVLKPSSHNDNISSHHTNACNCGVSKVPTNLCNSAVINLKDSFPSEENVGDRDPQLGTRLVVQALPSLTIKRNLSIQKAPSVLIPPPDAQPYVPPRQNVGLCEITHTNIPLDLCDCTSELCDHKKRADKKGSKAECRKPEETRKHTHQKHGIYKGSRASSQLDKRDRVSRERIHKNLELQAVEAVGSRSGKCNECEGYFLTDEMKGGQCVTCYSKCRNIPKKLPTENESHKTKPPRCSSGSLVEPSSTEQYQFLCKRCGNNFPLSDLFYGVCGKCCNIPSSVRDANQLMHGSTSDAVKAAAHLTQCSSCFKHFPQSELFYGHCIHCQIVKKEMRLLQCNVCLNSVISTEYSNGTCNQCCDKIKSDTQKNKLCVLVHPSHQGPAKERILNTVLDGTPIFFDISKAQCLNENPSTVENTVQNKKENCPLPGAIKKRESCSVLGTSVKSTGFVADDTTRKNRGINSKVHFEIEEYLNDNENKSIKEPLGVPKQTERKVIKLQETPSEELESKDYHKSCAIIRTAGKRQTTLYSGAKDGEHLSFHAQNCDKDDTSSDSNGCIHMIEQAAYDSVSNDDGCNATNDNSGYEQDTESGNKSTDTEVEVSDIGGYPRMYPSAFKLHETWTHVLEVAAVEAAAENLVKENPKWVQAEYGSHLPVINTVLHHQLGTNNRGESGSDPNDLSRPLSKILEPGDETDESSNRVYSDNYDDISEAISDRSVRVKIGSRDESLDHGNISKNAPANSRQHDKYLFDDHSENLQAADKSKSSTSKSKQHATTIRKVTCTCCNWQHGTESRFDSTRHSTHEYPRHCLDGNYIRAKPLRTQKVANVNKQKRSQGTTAVSEKCSGRRMNSKDDNDEEKHYEVIVTKMEDELLKDLLEQAGEEADKNMSPVSFVPSAAEPKVGETSFADNRSVNEDDYVYEDDWEEEPEKKDSEEERKGMDDESHSSKEIPNISGTDSEDIARSADEAALSLQPPELLQEQPCHSPSTKITDPTETSEKTTPHGAMSKTPPVCPVKASNKEHYQKFLYMDHEISSLNILPFKSVDKGSSPIDILTENPMGRGTSSNDSVEHIHKSSSLSIPEKTYVDRDSSPVNIPSAIIIPSEKSLNKSTSPVIFLSPKPAVPPHNANCTDTNTYGVKVANKLHGIALHKTEVARSITNMQSMGQQTMLPEQTGKINGVSKIHPETQHSAENKVEPLDTVLPANGIKRTDTETQTDTVAELTGLHSDKKEKIKEKKHRLLASGQSHLHDEPNSSSLIRQEILPIQQEVVPYSSASSSPHAYITEMSRRTPSVSNEQVSTSDDEQLVSYRSCSVEELFPEEHSCSCQTGSHSMGEVWNCHCFETHCLCSEGEIVVDDTLRRGQHVSRKQHTSRTLIVNGIIIHSNVPNQDAFDASEGTNNSLPSADAAAMDAAVQHPRRSQGPCDQPRVECNSRSEGELSEGQVIIWQQ